MALDEGGFLLAPIARGLGFFAFLPLGKGVSGSFRKLAAGILLGVLAAFDTNFSSAGAGVILGELLIGVWCTLPLALLISLAGGFGELLDTGRGENIGASYDPLSRHPSSAHGTIARWYLVALFFQIGGGKVLLRSYFNSFAIRPPAALTGGELLEFGRTLTLYLVRLLHGLIYTFLPFGILFLLVDLAAGFIGRITPKGEIFSQSFLVKSISATLLLSGLARLASAEDLLPFGLPLFSKGAR